MYVDVKGWYVYIFDVASKYLDGVGTSYVSFACYVDGMSLLSVLYACGAYVICLLMDVHKNHALWNSEELSMILTYSMSSEQYIYIHYNL